MITFKKYLPILIVFILTFSIRLYWIAQKDFLYHDAPSTFSVSTPNNLDDDKIFKKYWNRFEFKKDYPYTAKNLKEMMFATDGTAGSLVKDINTLH